MDVNPPEVAIYRYWSIAIWHNLTHNWFFHSEGLFCPATCTASYSLLPIVGSIPASVLRSYTWPTKTSGKERRSPGSKWSTEMVLSPCVQWPFDQEAPFGISKVVQEKCKTYKNGLEFASFHSPAGMEIHPLPSRRIGARVSRRRRQVS